MREHQTYVAMVLVMMATTALPGCYSSSNGTKIDNNKLTSIQKGVTTRQQVEQMFGPPDYTSMIPNGTGRRMSVWNHSEVESHAGPEAYVPVVNIFANHAQATSKTESLQVTYNGSDVVEDFNFTSGAKTSDVHGGMFGMSTSTSNAATSPADK